MSYSTLNISQLAEISRLDRGTVRKRLANLTPVKKAAKETLYDAFDALNLLLPGSRAADHEGDIGEEMLKQQLRYEEARADKTRLEADRIAGLQVAIEDVTRVVSKEYTYVRATLYSIPNKLDRALALEDDPTKCNQLLRAQIDEALAHLQADTNLNIEPSEEGTTTEEADTIE